MGGWSCHWLCLLPLLRLPQIQCLPQGRCLGAWRVWWRSWWGQRLNGIEGIRSIGDMLLSSIVLLHGQADLVLLLKHGIKLGIRLGVWFSGIIGVSDKLEGRVSKQLGPVF